MSGVKTTDYRIARERAEKIARIKGITARQAEVETLRGRMDEMLGNVSDGLRATFANEVERAQRWLALPDPSTIRAEMRTGVAELADAYQAWDAGAQAGRQQYEALQLAFTRKADALGQRLAKLVTQAEGQIVGARKLLVLWYSEPQVAAWEAQIRETRQLLDQEAYSELETRITALHTELAERIASADSREEQQQKRLYLLKALRQVCAEMGFEEVEAPHYAQDGDRGSTLLFTVDTIARGKITFKLTFDGISTFSELADDHCPTDFANITQYLEDEFGISTEFYGEDGKPIPKLIAKGEMDEPTGKSRAMERG
jgi:hypothetical protein